MDTTTDVRVSDLKKELLLKVAELNSALASVAELTKKLKESDFSLKRTQKSLDTADSAAAISDTELRTAEDALALSDAALARKSEELLVAIEHLTIANEKLRHSRDLQEAFISIAAHELKNPIQPLLGIADYLETLQNSVVGTEKIEVSKGDIEIIVRNARRLERLSNDILDVSRIEGKSLRLNKQSFDLNREIEDVVRDTQMYGLNNGERAQITFRAGATPDGAIMIHADKSRIYEVISNLLGNAIKYTDNGSIRIISAITKDKFALVRVKDTGRGISPQLLPQLFSKFGAVGNPNDVKSGTGLGLFIARGIIDAHGGKIWAENNKDEKGASFTFTLPIDTP